MSNLKHTPGPWYVATNGGKPEDEPAFPNVYIDTEAGVDVCAVTYGDSETCKANARLISAAPEMLEALIDLHEVLCTTAKLQDWHTETFMAIIGNAQAVIEKATGMKIEEVLS